MSFRGRRAGERVREFAETARRLGQERKAAPAIVDPLLQHTPRANWPDLAELPDLHSLGALERLGNLFAEWLPRDVVYATAIAELAVSAAEAMPETAYPPPVMGQVRAHAWKDLGKALRCLGKNDEAIEVFGTAERHLDASRGALAHDVAIVRFNLLGLVRLDFLRQSMHEEAGICGLEMIQALLLLDRPGEAETLARTVISEFTVAGLSARAITALDYLSKAIAARP